jgi:hypothetical protein
MMPRIRPILWDVNHEAEPPTMTVLLVGRPHRYVTVEIERRPTPDMTVSAAVAEMTETERAVYEVMAIEAV